MTLTLRLKKFNFPPFYTQLKADRHDQEDSLHLLPHLLPRGPPCAPKIYAQRTIEGAKDGHNRHLMEFGESCSPLSILADESRSPNPSIEGCGLPRQP